MFESERVVGQEPRRFARTNVCVCSPLDKVFRRFGLTNGKVFYSAASGFCGSFLSLGDEAASSSVVFRSISWVITIRRCYLSILGFSASLGVPLWIRSICSTVSVPLLYLLVLNGRRMCLV